MRKYLFLFTFLLLSAKSFAQDKDFNYKFYGQIRTDFYYNSRANEETVDGLFYMYPQRKTLARCSRQQLVRSPCIRTFRRKHIQ
jgi:ethanolamine utilization cobalamin adenosyltransferase